MNDAPNLDMLNVIAIDPGASTGLAFFHNRQLQGAWCLPHKHALRQVAQMLGLSYAVPGDSGYTAGWQVSLPVLIGEKPQIYAAGKSKADPNDIVTLGVKLGGYFGVAELAGARTCEVLPATWKRQIPKLVAQKRIKRTLSEQEHEAIRNLAVLSDSLAHNAYDAIGIGLHYVGRSILRSH